MQGFNMGRYVPPDLEGTTSANKLHKKHALGQRASKLASHGVLTVRFEMPFPIWCSSCPKPTIIAQGVRFNAEKKKVGNYYTTTIWSFRFRHASCGGTIEMRTDPKNTAYIVVEGATKRDTGEDKGPREGDEALVIMTDQEREALRKNAFASLEKTIEDREKLKIASARIEDLRDAQAKHWDDPYAMNQKLRTAFRVGRKGREKDQVKTDELRDRMGLGIELVPETEEDARRAALIDYGSGEEHDGGKKALAKPLFKVATEKSIPSDDPRRKGSSHKLKAEKQAAYRKDAFVSAIVSNTRLVKDPFLHKQDVVKLGKLPGVKRKRAEDKGAETAAAPPPPAKMVHAREKNSTALVEYDSD
ncbi:Protein saf4 [Conoideocrella luteorostrata]|uniref:Protein saf4 n=1 Tax=Conoideocrella luteorostrata TaxID=1105319 RepID=A0AAJ0G288_9HYPO|nr:Protein saf4 [Conoideocrella luteorostrata]